MAQSSYTPSVVEAENRAILAVALAANADARTASLYPEHRANVDAAGQSFARPTVLCSRCSRRKSFERSSWLRESAL
jgi:hypothetical protein